MANFSEEVIQRVWEKGEIKAGSNPVLQRFDVYGAAMLRSEYGNRSHDLGWEIDHIVPIVSGGSDDISNLQPLYWDNNVRKGDNPVDGDFATASFVPKTSNQESDE